MAKVSKKRRRRAPTKNEKPTGVLRIETDLGLIYVKLIVRYRDCVAKRSNLKDQMDMLTSMGGVEQESSNVSSEIEQLDQEIHQLKLSLVDIGGSLKQKLYETDVDAGLIKRLELRGWLDDSLYEDLCVRLDEWRCKKRRVSRAKLAQETVEVQTPVDQANGDGAESDRTGVNESPLMDDPIANHELARLAKLDPTTVSRQLSSALGKAKVARKKVEPGHARWWSHRELRKAYPHLPDGKLQKRLNCIRM